MDVMFQTIPLFGVSGPYDESARRVGGYPRDGPVRFVRLRFYAARSRLSARTLVSRYVFAATEGLEYRPPTDRAFLNFQGAVSDHREIGSASVPADVNAENF